MILWRIIGRQQDMAKVSIYSIVFTLPASLANQKYGRGRSSDVKSAPATTTILGLCGRTNIEPVDKAVALRSAFSSS